MNLKKNLPLVFLFLFAVGLRATGLKLGLPSETGGLTTLHPDESVTFFSLERMKPAELDFYPGDVALTWGTLHLYTVGAILKTLDIAGVIKIGGRESLKGSLGEVDKMYLSARWLSVVFGALAVVALYFVGSLFLSGRAAMAAALLLAVSQAPVMASYLVKTDSMMLFFALVSVYFSLKLLREPSTRNYALAGLFLGLAFVTKYSAALVAFFPFAAHFYHAYKARSPLFNIKKLLVFALSGLGAFLVCNPYFILRTRDEVNAMFFNFSKGKMGGDVFSLYVSYFSTVLPAAFGWSMVPFGLAGVARWLKGGVSEKTLIAAYCVLFLVWAGATSGTYVLYALPLAPFLFLAAGDLAASLLGRRWGKLLVVAVFAQVLSYTLYLKYHYVSDYTIKTADAWIRENLPEGATVAIAKNDTWTPFVVRRHAGSFKVIEGAASQAPLMEAVVELGKIYAKADYVVLSECEYNFTRSMPEKYPAEAAAIEKIFAGTREVKRFSRGLPRYVLPFQYKYAYGSQPPLELQVNFMNPDILVLKVDKK
ncbi:MAG TPA: hypothetical protein DCW72_05690 [Elusimicrobia bacterium]|nr:MAG: hypothetical protein A2X29_01550 [Elusimicrobia bacterium GWA2_64_40]OGR66713.1 MAG: hypothetical protein A2X30_06890 [Elusimicrobia bacterium GWB2_63_16]HAN04854.1 hypothetical protein [Elusimicrobiota bacterium]HAU89723.1 hypothetical protein [Elusimicrobiota bacterium]